MLKRFLCVLTAAIGLSMAIMPVDAEARRLGGGRPAGMQRQMPPAKQPTQPTQNQATPQQQPNQAAKPAAAGAQGAAAQAGRRSWMGPIAGLAAGLGIAALLSHFGLGEAFANGLTMVLLALIAFVAIRWLMRRFAGTGHAPATPQFAGAGAGQGGAGQGAPMARQSYQPQPVATPSAAPSAAASVAPAAAAALPAGFDAEGFERIAKMIFIRLQAANDAGQVEDLRKFTTPELFASLRLDLQERAGAAQQTDVMTLNAELIDAVQENDQWVATVRFTGLIREEVQAGAEPFDELWHLVRPVDGSREWAIAGITPQEAA